MQGSDRRMRVRVTRKEVEALDIVSLELRSDMGGLPRFSAGAHINLEIGPGLVRQYSLCNHPLEEDRYVVAVLLDPNSRGGSRAVHESINVADSIIISEPRNNFQLVPAEEVVLLAGGIGVTPIVSMADWLSHAGVRFQMHYCTRSQERTAFYSRLTRSTYAASVAFHFDDGPDGQKLNIDEALQAPNMGKHLYICGPRGFLDYAVLRARAQGWAPQNVHKEHFNALPQSHEGDSEFQVKIRSTGQVFTIPANESVTNALARQGIYIPVACESGICGTCLTGVCAGELEHRDAYLTEDERCRNDRFAPCCSRARSTMLVLDL